MKFRLHGEKLNGDFALVQMKGRGKGNEWLLLKKRDEFAVPGWDVEAHAYSVLSGRTQEEIAREPAGAPDHAPDRRRYRTRLGQPARRPNAEPRRLPRPPSPPRPGRRPSAISRVSKAPARPPMPTAIEPMLATLADKPPRGDDWLFEIKWDGIRAIAFLESEELRITSRSGLRCERQYPELAVMPHQVAARQAILDGEIAVLDEKGVSRFHLIQPRIANADPNSIAHLARSTPVVYFAFDLLYLDGYDLRGVALAERRELLQAVVAPGGVLRISEVFPGAGDELLEAAREHGLEGVVAKHASSVYESRRSREWVKIKIVGEQEFVIGGFTAPQGGRDHFGALVLGVYDDGELRWVGNVGTGFDQKLLASLHAASAAADRRNSARSPSVPSPTRASRGSSRNWSAR